MMKAIIVSNYGGTENMAYVDVSIPKVKEHEVLIRVVNTSVNFADIKTRYGNKGKGKLPYIPGIDAAGVIEKIGSCVSNFTVGQRVICFPTGGSYAEYVVASELLTFPIQDEIDFEMAAASPIVSFLSHLLLTNVARLVKGETILIHAAAGGVGTTAIQLAKILGAKTVIGTVGHESKISVAKDAGADEVICYNKGDFSKKVMMLTNNKGVDVILDSISGIVSEKSMECLAPFGRLVHFGNSSGETGTFKTVELHSSCRSVLGFSFGTTRQMRPDLLQHTADQVLGYIAERKLNVTIGRKFQLEDARTAHEWMESRKSVGKIILKV